jgi:thiamine-phosphate pyrophosphorylase
MIAPLHFISGQTAACSHPESIALACEAGVRWVQLRVKDQSEEAVFLQAAEAKYICRQYGAKLVINDYPAIAKAIGADGVHLGKEDMPVAEARKIVGNMVIGATANTFDDILAHARSGADYVGLGPFRFTNTKKKLSPLLGLEGYKNILAQCRLNGLQLPIIAIGGIELEDVAEILQTGVHGVAVSSLIARAENRQEVVENIHQKLQKTILRDA